MEDYTSDMQHFGHEPNAATLNDVGLLLKNAEVTFVTGLLVRELRAPREKTTLRSNVLKHLARLKRAGREDLPKVLRERAVQAIAFKLQI